jgi:Arc/MetJ family transcription regulator
VATDFTAVVADLDVLVTAQAARAVKLPTKKEQAA